MVQEASLFMKNMQRVTWILGFSERNMICFQRGLQIGELWNADTHASTICQLGVKANTDIWVLKHLIADERDDSGVLIKDIICRLHRELTSCRKLSLVSIWIVSTGSRLKSASEAFDIDQSVLSSLLPLQWPQELTFKQISHRGKSYAARLLMGASTAERFTAWEPHL